MAIPSKRDYYFHMPRMRGAKVDPYLRVPARVVRFDRATMTSGRRP